MIMTLYCRYNVSKWLETSASNLSRWPKVYHMAVLSVLGKNIKVTNLPPTLGRKEDGERRKMERTIQTETWNQIKRKLAGKLGTQACLFSLGLCPFWACIDGNGSLLVIIGCAGFALYTIATDNRMKMRETRSRKTVNISDKLCQPIACKINRLTRRQKKCCVESTMTSVYCRKTMPLRGL